MSLKAENPKGTVPVRPLASSETSGEGPRKLESGQTQTA